MAIARMIMIGALAFVLLISLTVTIPIATDASPTAQTQQGVYIGRQITMNGTNVNYWCGIPYAQQPLDNLRWMPPRALTIANDTKDAFIPNACPQPYDFGVLRTEACLTLNVHAPENATNLPVFVWIHGGSFYAGSGAEYNATPFVSVSVINSIPVVVVTINYRLGLLGFLADEALYDERTGSNNRSTTGNYAVLDQIMALDWIKKNIAGFGGNPEQITAGGESAGGITMTILLTSPLVATGTFQRAIVQSGSMWPDFANTLQEAINNTGNVLRATTDCTTIQCLRNLTVDEILVVQNIIASKRDVGVPGYPVIDGYVLSDIMENYYAKGNFQKVPLLIGSTRNEANIIICSIFNDTVNSTQVQAYLKVRYNATITDEIPTAYGPISTYKNPLTYLNTIMSDAWVHCGARRIASEFSRYGLSSYLYTYNHLIPTATSCAGVGHGTELPMLFPSVLRYFFPTYNFSALDQQLSTNMMLYWANFIHKSDPNYNGSPTDWTVYRPVTDADLVLDISPQMRNRFYNATCSGLWDLYAVTNGTITSTAVRYTAKHHCLAYFFVLFVLRFVSILTL